MELIGDLASAGKSSIIGIDSNSNERIVSLHFLLMLDRV